MKYGAHKAVHFVLLLSMTGLVLSGCGGPGPRGRGAGGPEGGGPQPFGEAAGGAPSPAPFGMLFAAMDVNADAITDRAELDSGLEREWARLTGLGSPRPGAIQLREWMVLAMGSDQNGPGFIGFDQNGDGTIARDEFYARLSSGFGQLDRNHDGQLERFELMPDRTGGPDGTRHGGPGGGRGPQGPGGGQRGPVI